MTGRFRSSWSVSAGHRVLWIALILTTDFDGEIVKFNIYDVMKYPNDDNPVYSIDVICSLAQEVFELDGKDEMEVTISKHLEKENEELALSTDLQETVAAVNDFLKL